MSTDVKEEVIKVELSEPQEQQNENVPRVLPDIAPPPCPSPITKPRRNTQSKQNSQLSKQVDSIVPIDGWLSGVGVKQLEDTEVVKPVQLEVEDVKVEAPVAKPIEENPVQERIPLENAKEEEPKNTSQDELGSKSKRRNVMSFLKKKDPKSEEEESPATPKADRKNRFSSFFGKSFSGAHVTNAVAISGPVLVGPPPTMGQTSLPINPNGPVFPLANQTPLPPPPQLASNKQDLKIERLNSTKTFKNDILKRVEGLETQVKELKEIVEKLVQENNELKKRP